MDEREVRGSLMDILSVRKGRGSWICETRNGCRLLKEYRGTARRLEFEDEVLGRLDTRGSLRADRYLRNREGGLMTVTGDGTRYILKDWFLDRECNIKDGYEIRQALSRLAMLHSQLRKIEFKEEWNMGSILSGPLEEELERHNREMQRARNYIRSKRKKTEFELCVIGSYLAQDAFGGDALGRSITINGTPFTVIGVMAEYADSTEGSSDDVIFIPYGNAMQLNGSGWVDLYLFNSADKDTANLAKGIIESRLYQTFQTEDAYYAMSSAEMMDAMDAMLNTLMMILILIAAISLLVGGIGIMNIMLVSVTERTREIGIRKSLGAKERYIMQQFVIEAACTSALGGIVGILIGRGLSFAASELATRLMGETLTVSPTVAAVALAFGISVGIGILFGYLPAKKAAGLNPIDALHYD